MKLKIFLDSDSYEWLWNHVPRQALSRDAINAAVLLGHTRVIDCDDVEARDLFLARKATVPVPFVGLLRQCARRGWIFNLITCQT